MVSLQACTTTTFLNSVDNSEDRRLMWDAYVKRLGICPDDEDAMREVARRFEMEPRCYLLLDDWSRGCVIGKMTSDV